jgi:hypothetical protein
LGIDLVQEAQAFRRWRFAGPISEGVKVVLRDGSRSVPLSYRKVRRLRAGY